MLRAAVEDVRRWTPADGPLLPNIDAAFRRAQDRGVPERALAPTLVDMLEAVPEELRPRRIDRLGPPSSTVVRSFLAAHAFANWTAHLGQGLRSWLRSVEAACAVVNELGVRQTDLLLRHLADPNDLARIWSQAETSPRRSTRKA
jgi:hypothetical protein